MGHSRLPLAVLAALTCCASPYVAPLMAEELNSASGHGLIERLTPSGDPTEPLKSEQVVFNPHYSFAYVDGQRATWLVLTEKQPPWDQWRKVSDKDTARQKWCETEKASFVALKLDKNMAVDLYFHCPGDGNVSTEMLSTINGLDSLVVKLDVHSEKQIKGTLKGGEGNCPTPDGRNSEGQAHYCTEKADFAFDAQL